MNILFHLLFANLLCAAKYLHGDMLFNKKLANEGDFKALHCNYRCLFFVFLTQSNKFVF